MAGRNRHRAADNHPTDLILRWTSNAARKQENTQIRRISNGPALPRNSSRTHLARQRSSFQIKLKFLDKTTASTTSVSDYILHRARSQIYQSLLNQQHSYSSANANHYASYAQSKRTQLSNRVDQ